MPSELELAENDSHWVLVKARLESVGRHYLSQLLVRRGNAEETTVSLPVSVHRDGRVDELVRVPDGAVRLQWQPPAAASIDAGRVSLRPVGWLERRCRMAYRVAVGWFEAPLGMKTRMGLTLRRALFDLPGAYRLATGFEGYYPWSEYADWIERFDTLDRHDVRQIEDHVRAFATRPRFQVLIAAHNATAEAVEATLASLRAQRYGEFECTTVSDDFDATRKAAASGDWLIFMRAGDTLAPHALYWFACAALENPRANFLYSDDDTMDAQGSRRDPRFKPDWSPAHLRSTHYIGAAAVLRSSAVAAAGGINPETVRHGNYDLLLRIGDASDAKPIHVSAVLFHRRDLGTSNKVQGTRYPDGASRAASYKPQATSHEPPATSHSGPATSYKLQATSHIGSELPGTRDKVQGSRYTAEDAWENPEWCMEKLREHLARIGSPAEVEATLPGCWRVRYRLPEAPPMISIIVPTRDAVALLRQCVESVLEKTTYPRFEILVVDNQSSDPETLAYFEKISANPAVRVLRYDQPFNYSAINNFAAREAKGEVLCLLNNDTEVISPDWLEEMMGQLLQEGVGAVGARLLYPDGRVQHAGVTVGPGGGADHLHGHCAGEEPGYCNRARITHELSAVTAACILTRKDVYQKVGGFDERNLTVAFNDVDYCLRLQEAGLRVVYTADAEMFHHESATRGREETWRKRRRAKREVRYLHERWAARLEHDPYYNANFSYKQPDFSLAVAPRVRKPWR
jgi:GT2 family glycosyltransferase